MTPTLARIGAVVFVSGSCSLVYQVAWLRLLRLVFGSSTAAAAAVLAIFMGGLGLGGALLGRRAERSANPLAFYARPQPRPGGAAGHAAAERRPAPGRRPRRALRRAARELRAFLAVEPPVLEDAASPLGEGL